MTSRIFVPGLVALVGLSACSSATEAVRQDLSGSAVRSESGTVAVTTDAGGEISLPNNPIVANDQPVWFASGEDSDIFAVAFESDDAFAIGGFQGDDTFSAVSGVLVDAPTGSLTYQGRYSLVEQGDQVAQASSTLTITYDAGEGTLSALDGRFALSGTVTADGQTTGTVTFEDAEAPYTGGFFGEDADVAAAFNNDTFGGVFYGEAVD